MSWCNICLDCGAYLDCGEKCDCREKSEQLRKKFEQITTVSNDGQIIFGGNYEYNKNQNKKSLWN